MNIKFGIYIRLSKEDLKPGESESISNQRSLLKTFCKNKKLHIVNEYVDDGISGTTFQRPSFEKMIQDIENKKINMIITKDLSRLGRDYIGTGYYLEKYFPEKHIRYISLLDGIDTGIDNTFNDITPFKSVLNDMYAKDISNKIKSVKHNKQTLGLFIGGKAPFGYQLNRKRQANQLFVDEEAKEIIQRIFKEACSGKSCRAIAMNLTLDKIPTPSQYAIAHGNKVAKISKIWTSARIREILLNEVYIGNMVQGRMKKVSYKSKKNIRLPQEEWKVVENTHEAIIEKEIFVKANEMLTSRKQTRVKKHDYLLKGLVYCHECGKKMGISPRKLSQGEVYYFRCNTYTANAKLGYCTSHYIRMDVVERIVYSQIQQILNSFDKEKIRKLIEQKLQEKNNISEKVLEEQKAKLLKIYFEIDNLYNDKLKEIITIEDFQRLYKQKQEEKKKIQKKIKELNSDKQEEINNINNPPINREIIIQLIHKIEIAEDKKVYMYFKFNK